MWKLWRLPLNVVNVGLPTEECLEILPRGTVRSDMQRWLCAAEFSIQKSKR